MVNALVNAVIALVSGSSGRGSSPSQGNCVVSWARHFTLTVPLSIQVSVYSCFDKGCRTKAVCTGRAALLRRETPLNYSRDALKLYGNINIEKLGLVSLQLTLA